MLKIENLAYAYDNTAVLKDIDLQVKEGEIICLLGPSGCGKTTLLRVIAGLETDYSGFVEYDGKALGNIPIHKRGFGLMFQDFALFPHMTVAENVAFGLKMQGISTKERQKKVGDALALVNLSDYHQRDISQLSGGEKQRVALARSIAPQPSLLMLDEPLGSLDAGLRERLVVDLREIIKRVGLTAIYVTHDQQEAFAIADRIALMNSGRIEQIGTPQDIYKQPKTVFVAQFMGLENVLAKNPLTKAEEQVLIHPLGITLDINGVVDGRVREVVYRGSTYRIIIETEFGDLRFTINSDNQAPTTGDTVKLNINPNYVLTIR